MSLNEAQAFAFSLAITLMAAIIIFRAGDGTLGVYLNSQAVSRRHLTDPFRSIRCRRCAAHLGAPKGGKSQGYGRRIRLLAHQLAISGDRP